MATGCPGTRRRPRAEPTIVRSRSAAVAPSPYEPGCPMWRRRQQRADALAERVDPGGRRFRHRHAVVAVAAGDHGHLVRAGRRGRGVSDELEGGVDRIRSTDGEEEPIDPVQHDPRERLGGRVPPAWSGRRSSTRSRVVASSLRRLGESSGPADDDVVQAAEGVDVLRRWLAVSVMPLALSMTSGPSSAMRPRDAHLQDGVGRSGADVVRLPCRLGCAEAGSAGSATAASPISVPTLDGSPPRRRCAASTWHNWAGVR